MQPGSLPQRQSSLCRALRGTHRCPCWEDPPLLPPCPWRGPPQREARVNWGEVPGGHSASAWWRRDLVTCLPPVLHTHSPHLPPKRKDPPTLSPRGRGVGGAAGLALFAA